MTGHGIVFVSALRSSPRAARDDTRARPLARRLLHSSSMSRTTPLTVGVVSATLLIIALAPRVAGAHAGLDAVRTTSTATAMSASAPPALATKQQDVRITGAPGKGVTLETESFSMNLRARIQPRYNLEISAPDANDRRTKLQTISIGTARLWFSGHFIRPELTYMIQLAVAGRDYRDGQISPIFDAFVDWKPSRDLAVRVGQFFVPFDRLRTVREFALQMGDRPRPVGELTLDRDTGVMLYSDKFLGEASPLAYRLGLFGGGGTNLLTGKRAGALVVGRLELAPLGPIDADSEGDLERRAKPGLSVGVGVAGNFNTNRARSTTGATFAGGTLDFYHAAADLVFKWHGFALQAEYLLRKANVDVIRSIDAMGAARNEATRSGRGWVLQGSYTFDPPLELVGRLTQLYASPGTDARFGQEIRSKGREVGVGANYYINGHRFKIQTDLIARMPRNFELASADYVAHLQLDVTF